MASLGEISWYRGDSFPIQLTIKDKASSSPIDITGYAFTMTINIEQDPADDTNEVFSVIGEIDPDQVANIGKVTFTPDSADTNIDPADYYYDVQMQDPASNIRTIAKDKFKIVQDITK